MAKEKQSLNKKSSDTKPESALTPEALELGLRERIVGQEEAISAIVDIYRMYLAGFLEGIRPIGNFLFLGPTGTGKTRIVEATAEILAGTPRAVTKIDCAEFGFGHEVAKLIGSPPGYLGHRETHPLLSQEAINQYHTESNKISFVLFDEIEKANYTLANLLLGILDKATLTLGDNRRVDFSQSMIFLTSNLGSREIVNILDPRFGFEAGQIKNDGQSDAQIKDRVKKSAIDGLKRKFSPEFINRFDKIVVFLHLGPKEIEQILELELSYAQQRIWNSNYPVDISLTKSAKEFLLSKGFDKKYGARHLKRAIDNLLMLPFAKWLEKKALVVLTLNVNKVIVDYNSSTDGLSFTPKF